MKANWKILQISDKRRKRKYEEIDPLIESILFQRGLKNKAQMKSFMVPDYEADLANPFLLSDMKQAVGRIKTAMKKNEVVCVFGDYDADGVTSAAMLDDFFNQINLRHFCYIPDRNKEGYGMNKGAIDYIKDKGATLIITVDCGITNVAEVAYAHGLGIDVIVIDHHHVPEQVPEAVALINPKKPRDKYPEKNLAGVGVAFKFVQAVAEGIGYDRQKIKWMLDLVAVGTIADCVPLLGENRTLAKFGLIVLSKTRRVGLKQLFQVSRIAIDDHHLATSQQVAFQVAPRINAAGRMDHANTAYMLLTCDVDDQPQARVLALELEEKNQRRQKITKVIVDDVEKRLSAQKSLPNIIIEADPHWELGVIGLAAGKIAEKYARPVILFHIEDQLCKGSGRSIKALNLVEALERNANFFDKFGGHSQAAGMTLQLAKLEEFKNIFIKEGDHFTEQDLLKEVLIDAKLEFGQINDSLVKAVELFEPYGQENRQPVFLSQGVTINDKRLIGNDGQHIKLWLKDEADKSGKIFEAIGFGIGDRFEELVTGGKIEVVFYIERDSWNGNEKIQLRVIDFMPV
jgi:single-stranded-DNA-specific exonuclease